MPKTAPFKPFMTIVHEEKNGDLSLVPIKTPVQTLENQSDYIKAKHLLDNAKRQYLATLPAGQRK